MRREDIRIRDPYVLPCNGKYYLYGTGTPNAENIDIGRQFWCYVSEDLEEWSNPILCFEAPDDFWGEYNFWAPEVHQYHGKYYMFASFYAKGKNRATQALVADAPEGPFRVFGEPLTPPEWMCLDGTLFVEDEKPYLIFCHEWTQVGDGEIAIIPLKLDLSAPSGEARILFRASEAGWAHEICPGNLKGIVTDGPWIVKENKKLIMFWSSFHNGSYAVGMAISENGSIFGPWRHSERLLFEKDGGHGMLFEGINGKKYFTLHQPNNAPLERPCFFEIKETDDEYCLV